MPPNQSLVGQWNELMLDAIRSTGASPTPTTYNMHLVSTAIYDAWAAYDDDAYGYYTDFVRPESEHSDDNKAMAISYAAHRMLSELFPTEKASFDAFMAQLGYDAVIATADPSNPAYLGELAFQGVLAARVGDGSNRENSFQDTSGYLPVNDPQEGSDGAPGGQNFDPNHWQPLRVPTGTLVDENGNPIYSDEDPSTYKDQVPMTPHWGEVTAFALESGSQVRPDGPPVLGDFSEYVDGLGNVTTSDQAYRDQFTAVAEASAALTSEHKVIAEYWADGPRTESPPGHWNQIAQDIALREGHGIDDDAKMFFALNAALLDAGIATWDAKYAYDSVRPQSAIRNLFYDQEIEAWAGPDLGVQTILAQAWQPYQDTTFVTPPFPEFTSGHSSFSMAAARTIAAYVGSDAYYDGTSQSNYDLDDIEGIDLLGKYVANSLIFETFSGDPVTLQWATLTEAAEQAGISRIYGGIHIQDGDLNGRQIGRDVAELGQVRWDALFTRAGDDDILGTEDAEMLFAGTGNDTVDAAAGNDKIEGGTGNDTIDGGTGFDTAFYSAERASYTVTVSPDGVSVLDRRADGDGTDQIGNIEELSFNDLDWALEKFDGAPLISQSQIRELVEVFVGYFNRAPDAEGLFFYGTALAQGTGLEQAVATFLNSAEYQTAYPSDLTNQEFAEAVYNNVLGRIPDAPGLAFWVGLLDSGSIGRDTFILEVLEGAKAPPPAGAAQAFIDQQAADISYLNAKTDVGLYFSMTRGMSDISNASAVMQIFDDGDQADIDAANAATDSFYADALDPENGEFLLQLIGVADTDLLI